jgi:hypothetical protein
MKKFRRIAAVAAVAAAVAVVGASSAVAGTVKPINAVGREIGPNDEFTIAKQFAGLTATAVIGCANVSVVRVIEVLRAPIKLALPFAVFRTDLVTLLSGGASDPCTVALGAARAAAAMWGLAVQGRSSTVLARLDEVSQFPRSLCWARFAIGTPSGSAVPFDVKFWKPLSGCGAARV